MVKQYSVKYGAVAEAGCAVSVTVGGEAIAKPVEGGWEATVVGIGYTTFGETYGEALDRCIERFQEDIGKKITNGDRLPKGLKRDFRKWLFEDD